MKILRSKTLWGAFALVGILMPLRAVETKMWQQAEMSDFGKGTLTRLSLSSDGQLSVAPVLKRIFDSNAAFLWAVARDSHGNVYTGGGGLGSSKVKLFEADPRGNVKTLAELEGMALQAIAIDGKDRVYAATSPDGKVYRVDQAGKVETFYDPKAKYIWALAFDKAGNLFVATGDQGEIYRVTPSGEGSVFFRTEETHARSLAVDASGNLIVGTDPSGLILRVTPAGQGFVLYQAPKREITAVAVAPDGTIYAAGAGNKQVTPEPAPAARPERSSSPARATVSGNNITITTVRPRPSPTLPPAMGGAATAIAGGSEIYRIETDGYPHKIWSHPQDLVYALALDSRGHLLAGTGNHGAVYRIDSAHSYTQLLTVPPTQVTGLCPAPNGTVYAVTGNIGELFAIGPGKDASGTYDSDVLDGDAFSYWGRILTDPAAADGGPAPGAVFETRSGNLSRPQQNWSPWQKLNAGRITSPPARFLEYRVTLSGDAKLNEIDVAYQMKNAAPFIEELEITPPNYKFPPPPSTAPANQTLSLPPLGQPTPGTPHAASAPATLNTPALTYAKGETGARWLAVDPNDDTLVYKVEIRGVNETTWKLIRDKVHQPYLSWDSSAYPDGKYVLRVTASDEPSNPPGQALTASRVSDWFLIDNTPPEISGLTATPAGGKIELSFHAQDALSILDKAEYSVNGGEWMVVEPTTRLTDSTTHDYRAAVSAGTGENTIAVRVSDSYDNQATAKIVVK
jgi:hypothetical protein